MKLIASLFSLLFFCSLPLDAHYSNHQHNLLVEGAWAPHTGKRTMSAAVYFTLKNTGENPDTLTGISSPLAAIAMLHESKEVVGVMVMEYVDRLSVPAGGKAELTPGSQHVMMMQLTKPLKRGEVFPLTLSFEKAGDVTVFVDITGIGGPE